VAGLTRQALLRRTAVGGAAIAAGGATAPLLLATQARAAPVPDSDLTYLRLLVGVELLAVDFHTRALAGGKLGTASTTLVKQLLSDEKAHYAGVAQLLTAAGQAPATADDIDFAYPKGTFSSEAATLRAAGAIESLALGAYLGAIQSIQSGDLRLPVGQIAANEAQHLGAVSARAGRRPVGRPFAAALDIDAASRALDVYES
jgi:hypothetical protein